MMERWDGEIKAAPSAVLQVVGFASYLPTPSGDPVRRSWDIRLYFQRQTRRRLSSLRVVDDDFTIRPGRSRDRGAGAYRKAGTLVGRVVQASRRAGFTALGRRKPKKGTGACGRGRSAALQRRRSAFQRRVVIKARVVRHRGARFRSAPLARHVAYLERDGVTRDGSGGRMFDAASDEADGNAFADRCEDDRHHFRFIVSPEDAGDMADLRVFTRELMEDMARDLDTRIDWVAIDHWNTDNPHIHLLVRGVAGDGKDLVIDRGYISAGLRQRAEERVTIELGPRREREIRNALRREVDAERWTSLDRRLHRQRDELGRVDLRPEPIQRARSDRLLLIGRARVLERMGLAQRIGPVSWTLAQDCEPSLRALGDRGDIIRTMHRAMSDRGLTSDPARIALHDASSHQPVVGRLVERGLHDELSGEAYVIIDGIDGRAHHLRLPNLERTGDAMPEAVVATGAWTDRNGKQQISLLVCSDMSIESQIGARGATWLDRQLTSPRPEALAGAFGAQVSDALAKRTEVLLAEGLAKRSGQRTLFARDLLATLRDRDLADAGERLAARHGGSFQNGEVGDQVAGIYRERVAIASGRFAMIDNGLGFKLVPWRQDLDRHLGKTVRGLINQRGGVDWNFTRSRGPSI